MQSYRSGEEQITIDTWGRFTLASKVPDNAMLGITGLRAAHIIAILSIKLAGPRGALGKYFLALGVGIAYLHGLCSWRAWSRSLETCSKWR